MPTSSTVHNEQWLPRRCTLPLSALGYPTACLPVRACRPVPAHSRAPSRCPALCTSCPAAAPCAPTWRGAVRLRRLRPCLKWQPIRLHVRVRPRRLRRLRPCLWPCLKRHPFRLHLRARPARLRPCLRPYLKWQPFKLSLGSSRLRRLRPCLRWSGRARGRADQGACRDHRPSWLHVPMRPRRLGPRLRPRATLIRLIGVPL